MEFTHKRAVAPKFTLLLLALLAGCSDPKSPSSQYPVSSIYAYMKAVQDQSGVTTTVQLRDGATSTANYLYLSGGDALYSSLDKSPQQYIDFNGDLFGNSLDLSQHLKVMSSRSVLIDFGLFTVEAFGDPEYFALDAPAASSVPVRAYVGFERSGRVIESSVDLPVAFQITSPAADASVSRAAPISLTWTDVDPATTMELDVAGICTDNSRFSMHLLLGTDTGSATLSSANYLPAAGISPTINCRIAFQLQRVRFGAVSPEFAFGSLSGIQQRSVQFTSIP